MHKRIISCLPSTYHSLRLLSQLFFLLVVSRVKLLAISLHFLLLVFTLRLYNFSLLSNDGVILVLVVLHVFRIHFL